MTEGRLSSARASDQGNDLSLCLRRSGRVWRSSQGRCGSSPHSCIVRGIWVCSPTKKQASGGDISTADGFAKRRKVFFPTHSTWVCPRTQQEPHLREVPTTSGHAELIAPPVGACINYEEELHK